MTATPDTEIEAEQADQLLEALTVHMPNDDAIDAYAEIAPIVAAIRRQAAADALTEQARHLDSRARFWRELQRSHEAKGKPESADPYRHYADQAHRTATYLRKEAAGIIAEGYPFECAAFSQECETRVPDAGDYCARHEPEDDENRWAE